MIYRKIAYHMIERSFQNGSDKRNLTKRKKEGKHLVTKLTVRKALLSHCFPKKLKNKSKQDLRL